MDEDRLRHSLAVAKKMAEIAGSKELLKEDIKNRYKEESSVYKKCCDLVENIKNK